MLDLQCMQGIVSSAFNSNNGSLVSSPVVQLSSSHTSCAPVSGRQQLRSFHKCGSAALHKCSIQRLA